MKLRKKAVLATAIAMLSTTALADINVGVVASLTGPAAALGSDIKRVLPLLPATIGNEKVNYILLDDATDPSTAVKVTRKLIMENKADVIIGPNTNPSAAAMAQVVAEAKTPLLLTTPYLPPEAEKRAWVFQPVQSAGLMVQRLVDDMVASKAKTVGFIGFADSWGDLLFTELERAAGAAHIKIVAAERYKRPDTSVTAQVLKVSAARPDVIFIGASGAPAALPQIELRQRGYQGKIYQSHGVTTRDFLRIGGRHVEGALIPASPMLVAEQLPASMASKEAGTRLNAAYEKLYGADSRSTFAGSTSDAALLLVNAVPAALKAGKPGTDEFRVALRAALERTKDLVGINGTYTMSPADHNGLDQRARVLIEVRNGRWTYVK
ncbi:ABC transporter substrate-binding protein [Massilia sp. LXY-6]|uniref:ABC transporter substrate-binding protein n=1 Tax=Massilia sp. LXY-6 TaxID=3379823 RepID=UPI003EE199C2